ncbi:MAG: DUF3883 domain-containing protein [Oscillospiraceae bacterium]|nr:DUF3883 domain-containing protein [Oscillospiraceae bacterium]
MYREKISESIEKVYQAGVAAKILQYMNKIRNEADITQARRWVMELLQNARDLACEDKPLKVQIELNDDALVFRHSGKPFRVKDILSIVNQVSSKNPGDGVGQFGTGFMTTYQLSEKVEIHSVLKEEGFPGKEFRITLDRTGHNKEDILSAIFRSMDELLQADGLPDAADGRQDEEFGTEFRYLLENSRSRDIAETGVADLADTILYVMLFSGGIAGVEIIVDTEDKKDNIIYRRGKCTALNNNLTELDVIEERPGADEIVHRLLYMEKDGMTLAAEYDPEQGFLPISERTPRIFVDFPLIGAERFPFPAVINHLGFHPNEPRSGISLSDNPDSVDAAENKALIMSAVEIYGTFLKELLQFDTKGICNLIGISEWQDNKEWSEKWVRENIYDRLFGIIWQLPLFSTQKGMLPLMDGELHIIRSNDNEEMTDVKKLISVLKGFAVPDDDTDWYSILMPYGIPEGKAVDLERLILDAQNIMSESLDEEKMTAVMWNQLLYDTAMKKPSAATGILAGNTAIFPSQSPQDQMSHKLYTIRQIHLDPGIPEILKDAAEELSVLDDPERPEGSFIVRRKLLHSEFRLANENDVPRYELSALTEYIQTRCNRGYRVKNFQTYRTEYEQAWLNAWNMMLSCGPDDDMYLVWRQWQEGQLAEPVLMPERKKLEDTRFEKFLWRSTYCSVLESIVEKIIVLKKLSALRIQPVYPWLNSFYRRCAAYLDDSSFINRSIFPNQEGELYSLYALSRDRISDDELKDIAACFKGKDPSCNMYHELLDRSVNLDGWRFSEKNDSDVSMRINNTVQRLLMESSLSQAELIYQEACTLLLGWIEDHPDRAQELFPAFYKDEDRMKLLTPKAAASMQKKAKGYAQLMELLGTDDPEKAAFMVSSLRQEQAEYEFYDEESDTWIDGELMSVCPGDPGRVCREVGLAGEEYAFGLIREEIMKRGFEIVEEKVGFIRLRRENSEYTVSRPDTDRYHQPGWDIKVTGYSCDPDNPDSTPREKTISYLEVKTHTPGSVRSGMIHISNQQMKQAAAYPENYIILSVTYDYTKKQVNDLCAYKNPWRLIAEGELVSLSRGYKFSEAKK